MPFEGGQEFSVDNLANELATYDVEGLTLSGGEPFAQPAPLSRLIRLLRDLRPDWGFLSYSGFRLEWLLEHGSPTQLELLGQLDILVDGPYDPSRHTNLRWRGSDNQRVLFLTPRYREWRETARERGTFLEFQEERGGFRVVGILPQGFMSRLRDSFAEQGIALIDDTPPKQLTEGGTP